MGAPDILNVQVTETDVVNTTTETNLLLYTVPANTLGTNKAIRVLIRGDYLNNSAGAPSVRWRIYYGATEMYNDLGAGAAVDVSRRVFTVDFILWPRNATNSQGVGGTIFLGQAGGATTGIGNVADDEVLTACPIVGANASEDSTLAKDLKVTVAHTVANADVSIRKTYSVIESLPP